MAIGREWGGRGGGHMAHLILMYEMQSAAVKSAPLCGHLIGCMPLMPTNIWAQDDGSTLTRWMIAPREAQPRDVCNKESEQMITSVHSFVATVDLIIVLKDWQRRPRDADNTWRQLRTILVHHKTHLDALLIPSPSFQISWCVEKYNKKKERKK